MGGHALNRELTFDQEQIATAVKSRRDWAINALSQLVRQPTVLGKEELGQRVVASLFEDLQMEVKIEKIKLDEIKD